LFNEVGLRAAPAIGGNDNESGGPVIDPRRDRASGLLLHVSSLPGAYGIGELGTEAVAFIESLRAAGQRVWQMLPLGPVLDDGCPYGPGSVFAGNPLLVSTDRLLADRLVDEGDVTGLRTLPADRVDYRQVRRLKLDVLRRAFDRFRGDEALAEFRAENDWWLAEYALFDALSERFGVPWTRWPVEFASRRPDALARARRDLADHIKFVEFAQWLFARDFNHVREAAVRCGVSLVGDLPFYPNPDSADVWTHPELFLLSTGGRLTEIAGAPPDRFNPDGQIWGNVPYRWEAHEHTDFRWWTSRVQRASGMCDVLRLDHFSGFEACWVVPAGASSAREGHWRPGPGGKLFAALGANTIAVPLIVDDLGSSTPAVERMRAATGMPGMRVLQFARPGDGEAHLPHTYDRECVVYTGTHDNETTYGWWTGLGEPDRTPLRQYFGHIDEDVCWSLIRAAHQSVANLVVVPIQDVHRLGNEARMNEPGTQRDWWTWRLTHEPIGAANEHSLRELASTYGRLGVPNL
jgi:4-alpha-glucanotransferase